MQFDVARVKGLNANSRQRALFWIAFASLCAIAIGLVGRDLDLPGVYYDEVIQAEPSVRFLTRDPAPHAIPGAQQIRLFGRWFPVMTQPYMGALKSQLLIPVLALLGPAPEKIRATTLAWGLLGLLAMMAWARRDFGIRVAIGAGTLVALDPSFLFVSRHDWGSFAIGLICRCGALLLLSSGWNDSGRRSGAKLFGGGALLGLGVYNKIDFAVVVIAFGLALLAVRPGLLGELRSRISLTACGLAGAAVGLLPVAASLGSTLALTQQALARPGTASDISEKWHTWGAMFDGSYFHELMLSGGNFRTMSEFDGAAGPFAIVFALSWVVLAVRTFRARGAERDRAREFAVLCALLIPIGLLLTPRAIRIHHALLVVPFPQLVVAIAAVDLWQRGATWTRAVVTVATFAVIAGSLRSDIATFETIRESGGKGRWSNAIGGLAPSLEGTTAVSLDWGFELPLRFANRELSLVEPIWELSEASRIKRAWTFDGTKDHVYLLFEPQYAVFRYGERFLEAVDQLPEDRVTLRHHADAAGDPAFISVKIAGPHRLRYTGRFEVRLQSDGSSP